MNRLLEKQAALDAELFYEILIGEMAASNGALMDAQALEMEAARTSGSEQLYKCNPAGAAVAIRGEGAGKCPGMAGSGPAIDRSQ